MSNKSTTALTPVFSPTELLPFLYKRAVEFRFSKLSEATGIAQSHLYKALSPSGNPSMTTLVKVMNALGLEFIAADKQ